jgi:glycosyltransferase involved in cell wall biosynthesis
VAMKVSVAMCTFNGARYVAEQLRSIGEQTLLPDELIICDDCSIDDTVTIVRAFAQDAPFPVVIEINEENYGSTKNFEKAISLCTGDIIFLADQDDVWSSKKIARFEEQFRRSEDVGLVFSDAELVDENLQSLFARLWDFSFPPERRINSEKSTFYRTILQGNVVTGATAAFRSRFVKQILPVPIGIGNLIHDGWIAFVISCMADVKFIDEPLILYRIHPGQQIGMSMDLRLREVSTDGLFETIAETRMQKLVLEAMLTKLEQFTSLPTRQQIENSVRANLGLTEERILHLTNRLRVRQQKKKRLSIIVTELISGRYRLYSKGWLSAVKDLFVR